MTPVEEISALQRSLAGSFRIAREIGRGGMARVYEAVVEESDATVALKVLRPELVSLVERQRFLREIELVSRLSHPNILPVLSSGELPDSLFYTMPLLSGGTLRDRLDRETQLGIPDVQRVVREIGSALDYAASQQIVHRDVKPGNILLSADGSPVLADFGIARAIEQSAGDRLTYSQFAIGTPAYMSPEQHEPTASLDGRSDQYSLAVVAYEMLAGMPPFVAATTAAILARKTLDPMPSLRAIRREVPLEVERALSRALAVTPADRFASAKEFADAMLARRTSARAWRLLAGAAAVAGLGSALWFQLPKAQSPVVSKPRRVIVLPFANATGDSALGVVGLMAADWIAEGLSRTGSVDVVPTPSVLDARAGASAEMNGESGDASSRIAQSFGADVLVTGRVYLLRDSLRIQTQVADARQQQLLGTLQPIAISRRDPMDGIEQLRSRVMGLLVSALDTANTATAGASMVPPTFEAYRAFTRGLEEYARNDFANAARLLMESHAADSTFAVPLLFASISLSNLGEYAAADSVARRMSALSGSLSPLHRTWLEYRLRLLSGDRPSALQTVRELARLSPGTKATYNYAVEAYENGFYHEAIEALRTLDTERGPMRSWASWWDVMGSSHHLLGDFAAEERVGAEGRRKFPGRIFAQLPTARALAALGRFDDVDRLLTAASTLPEDPYGTSVGSLAVEAAREAAAHHGVEKARHPFERALAWYMSENRRDPTTLAWLQYSLGESGNALKTLEAYASGDSAAASAIGLLGTIYASQGAIDKALAQASRLAADQRPYQFGESRLAEARIHAALGDHEAALGALGRAFREGLAHDHWMHTMRELDAIRLDPRFVAMTRSRDGG